MIEPINASLLLETARHAGYAAADLLLRSFGKPLVVNSTYEHDIKIELDVNCQEIISQIILKAGPNHSILGEEGNSGSANPTVEWIVDPIDGTVNLFHEIPHFCISIAARDFATKEILAGIIHDPMRNEWFTAQRGQGAWLNGKQIYVSPRTELSQALLAVGFAKNADSIDHCLALYKYYGHAAKKLRAMGSAALDLAYVASGRMDAYIEQGVNLWDIAAGWILVEEAGGVMEVNVNPDGSLKVCGSSGRIEFPLK
jgi:myo-inositol-1(or 4)-monophosphatase